MSGSRLEAAAQAYHELGISVVPFCVTKNEKGEFEKKNIGYWKEYITRAQTNAEFNAIDWSQANAFSVVLGAKAKNGLYLAVVDYDTKGTQISDEAKTKGNMILKDFPITATEQTVNKGIHLVFWSEKPVKTDGSFHDLCGIELLGEKKLCLMSPSYGYSNRNDNSPTQVADLESLFSSILSKHGFRNNDESESEEKQSTNCFSIEKVVALAKLTRISPDEHQGSHPYHDSSTEKNFCVNTRLNEWYCFRHNSGGGALQLFAVKNGLMKCEHAKKGALRGKKFRQTVDLAIAEGLLPPNAFKKEEKEETIADRLVKLCLQQDSTLFFDQHTTPYIRVKTNTPCGTCGKNSTSITLSCRERFVKNGEGEDKVPEVYKIPQVSQPPLTKAYVTMPLRSKRLKDWLSHLMWVTEEKAAGSEALTSAINVLCGKALADGKQYTLYNRVAPSDGIWLDLCDDSWRAIHVTPDGWKVVDEPPILFRRYKHQKPLATPIEVPEAEEKEKLYTIFNFVNIDKTDEKTKLAFICTLISYFIPMIPHPILVVYGAQGSAKTWLFRLIRRLIDPSAIEVLSLPTDDRELVQQLDHHWLAPFDNISTIPTWASDTFCRAATGSGVSRRELYSDDDDVIYNYKRCIGLNGINPAARKGDLLDRSVLVCVEKITLETRKTEEQLNKEFDEEKAFILGAILGVLSKALKLYSEVKLHGFFRMADFTKYGAAISKALGLTEQKFVEAFQEKVDSQTDELLNSDPLAMVLLDFFTKFFAEKGENGKTPEEWNNTPNALFQEVLRHAESIGIRTDRHSSFPKAVNVFSRRLNEITPALLAKGYEATLKHGTPRKIIISLAKQTKLDSLVRTNGEQTGNKSEKSIDAEQRENSGSQSDLDYKKCASCADFRKPSCRSEGWEWKNGNESAIGYPCFADKNGGA